MGFEIHVLIALFVLVYPVMGYVSYRKLLARVAADEPVPRQQIYRGTIVNQWLLFTAALLFSSSADSQW